ncbi:MAG: AMP-binding enzyme, partial [Blastocatellia bacterium]
FNHVGRSDDCFKAKGMWVSPIEVEAALLTHPAVVEAAVVADFDDGGLATGRAYVVIREGVEAAGLAGVLCEHIRARLAHHKVPSTIEFLEGLPRTATGKVQRFKLRRERKASDG